MSKATEYERTGADGTTLYCCPICTRMELNSYEAWIWHLGSREHQLSLSRSCSPFYKSKGTQRHWNFGRCVEVRGILGLEARQVLDYLKTWGEVEDFCYHFMNGGENGHAKWCICLYRDKEGANACVGQRSQEYLGKTLEFKAFTSSNWGHKDDDQRKRKSDSEREWDGNKSRRKDDDEGFTRRRDGEGTSSSKSNRREWRD